MHMYIYIECVCDMTVFKRFVLKFAGLLFLLGAVRFRSLPDLNMGRNSLPFGVGFIYTSTSHFSCHISMYLYRYKHMHTDIYICAYTYNKQLNEQTRKQVNTQTKTCMYMYMRFKAGSRPLRFYTFFSNRHERHGLQTTQAAVLGNTAIYLAERKTCATL